MGLKEYFKKKQAEKAERRSKMKAIQDIQMKALHEQRLKEAKILGESQARIERKQKVKQLQHQVSSGGSGLMSSFSRRVNIAAENLGYAKGQNVLGFGGGYQARAQPSSKKKSKYVTIKGKKYMRVHSGKKKRSKQRSPSYSQPSYNPFQTSL